MTSSRIYLGIAAGSARGPKFYGGPRYPRVPLCVVRGARMATLLLIAGGPWGWNMRDSGAQRSRDNSTAPACGQLVSSRANPCVQGLHQKRRSGKISMVFRERPSARLTRRLAALICETRSSSGSDLVFSLHGGTTRGAQRLDRVLEVPDELGTATFAAAKALLSRPLSSAYLPGRPADPLRERGYPPSEGEWRSRHHGTVNVEYYKQRTGRLAIRNIGPNPKRFPTARSGGSNIAAQHGNPDRTGRVGATC